MRSVVVASSAHGHLGIASKAVHIIASPVTDFYAALGSMIGGIGTTLAFLLGVLVLFDDRRRRRRLEADDAVAQARLVDRRC
jgi:hypothetical protein